MTTRRSLSSIGRGSILAIVTTVFTSGCSPLQPIKTATGVISHTLCSGTFVSGLNPDQVYADSLRPIMGIKLFGWAFSRDVDITSRQVSVSFAGGFKTYAVYREGLGCLVVRDAQATQVTASAPPGATDNDVAGNVSAAPQIAAVAPVVSTNAKLQASVEQAFAETDPSRYRRTKAVVVMHDGQIVAERYAPGYGVDTALLGYSATKSVIGALIGVLVRQGQLTVEKPAPVPAWQQPGDPRQAITIDNLLRMTSGLAWGKETGGLDAATRMWYAERDMAAFAERFSLATAPGSKWNYSSGDWLILSRIIRDAVGGHDRDVVRFARRELFNPVGMHRATLEFDSTGTPIGSNFMLATARDWARFGLLYLNDGVVGGRRILPEGWVKYSTSPTLDTGYGAGFWINREVAGKVPVWDIDWGLAGAPKDAFFALGYLGQFVVVVPSERLVIVRLGMAYTPDGDAKGVGKLVASAIDALRNPPP